MSRSNIHILIADDHSMIRNGLRMMLHAGNPRHQFVVNEARDGEEAISAALKNNYDIILTDYNMPKFRGDEVTRRILFYKPESRVIILSNYNEKSFIQSSLDAGAKGYILKDIDVDDLVQCIEKVLEDEPFFPPDVAMKVLEENTQPSLPPDRGLDRLGITARELEVLKLIGRELTNVEIGQQLGISKRTVETYRQNLLAKTHSKNTAGLIRFALMHHIE
jgi:DNA-binding NarL/FixJ family response regulator